MKKLLLILLVFISTSTFSQTISEDAGMWITASVNKKLTRNWSLSLDQELRMFDNISRIQSFFTNIGVGYKIKDFKFSIAYRFINKNEDDMYYSIAHRMYGEAIYKYKWNEWALSYRFRIQGQVTEVNSSETGKAIESYLRHKFELSYKFDRLSPYAAVEYRYQLNNPKFQYTNYLVNRIGYYLGLDYDFNRVHSVGVYYLLLHHQNVKVPENDFVIGLEYTLNL